MQFQSFSNLKGNSIIKEVIEPFPASQIRDVVEPSNSFMLSHLFYDSSFFTVETITLIGVYQNAEMF